MASWTEFFQEIGREYVSAELGSNNQSPPPQQNPATGQVLDPATQRPIGGESGISVKNYVLMVGGVLAVALAVVFIARR